MRWQRKAIAEQAEDEHRVSNGQRFPVQIVESGTVEEGFQNAGNKYRAISLRECKLSE